MTTSQQPTRVYLAGPMFSAGDKMEQGASAAALEAAGFECHVPQNNGIEVAAVMQLLNDPSLHGSNMLEPLVLDRCIVWVTRTVVALDVYQVVEGCQCTVLNIDGRVPDEGSLVEATLAWYAGHPVVPYKTTSISELGGNNNPMIGVISRLGPGLFGSPGCRRRCEGSREVRRGRAAGDNAPARRPAADRPRPSDFRHPGATSPHQESAHNRRTDSGHHLPSADGATRARRAHCRRCASSWCSPSSSSANSARARTASDGRFPTEIAVLHAWAARPGTRDAIVTATPSPADELHPARQPQRADDGILSGTGVSVHLPRTTRPETLTAQACCRTGAGRAASRSRPPAWGHNQRAYTIPSGTPTRIPTVAATEDCHATVASSCRRVKPRVLRSARVPAAAAQRSGAGQTKCGERVDGQSEREAASGCCLWIDCSRSPPAHRGEGRPVEVPRCLGGRNWGLAPCLRQDTEPTRRRRNNRVLQRVPV